MSEETSIGIIIGAIFSFLMNYIFYMRSKRESEESSQEQRRANRAIIQTRDPAYNAVFSGENKIEKITVGMSANLRGNSESSANFEKYIK